MADWLDVMKGEMQAKRQVRDWLAERRSRNRKIAMERLEQVVRPVLRQAAEERGWQMEESVDEHDAAIRCVIFAPEPKAAFVEVAFDAVNPVAILRRHPGGADAESEATAVACSNLDRKALEDWLAAPYNSSSKPA